MCTKSYVQYGPMDMTFHVREVEEELKLFRPACPNLLGG